MDTIETPDANGNPHYVYTLDTTQAIGLDGFVFDTEQAQWLISALQAAVDQTLADEAEQTDKQDEQDAMDHAVTTGQKADNLTIVPGHHVADLEGDEGVVTCIYTRDEDGMRMATVRYGSEVLDQAIVDLHHAPRN